MPNKSGIATVTVQNFEPSGRITFQIQIADCEDSDGRFEYEYTIEFPEEHLETYSRRQTWTRTHGQNRADVEDNVSTTGGGKLVSVAISSVECNCYDEGYATTP